MRMMRYSNKDKPKKGDVLKAEIRDQTWRTVYKTKVNMSDKKALAAHINSIAEFSPFKLEDLLAEINKLHMQFRDDWF